MRSPLFSPALAVAMTLVGCGNANPNTTYIPIVAADTGAVAGGDVSEADTKADVSLGDVVAGDIGGQADTTAADTGAADTSKPIDGATDDGGAGLDAGPKDTGTTSPKPCAFDAETGAKPEICPLGQACVASIGSCTGWVSGVCKPAIVTCAALDQPVCGCDGKTYNNPCEAQKSQVTIKLGSACPAVGPVVCGGNTGKTCESGEVCDIDGCATGAAGVCVKGVGAGVCPDGGQQECGCDDNTYPNSCYRQKANVAKKHAGPCPDNPTTTLCKVGPIKPALCPTGTYCQVYDTNPIACVGTGECVKLPVVCDGSSKPVCGCDGKNYTNPCLLAQAQQNLKSTGQCGATTCTEGQGGCAASAYCAVPQGQCGIAGVCISKPPATACTGVIDPVCGCDGQTYTNPSCAAVQGVVVKTKGACGP